MQQENEFNEGWKLEKVLKHFDLSQAEFAQLLQINQSNVSGVITNKRALPKKWIYRLKLKYPEVNLQWFETGRGEMIERETGAIQEPNAEYVGAVLVMDNERLTKYVQQMMGKVAFLESEVEDLRLQVRELQKTAPK